MLAITLDASPVRFQLTRKRVTDLQDGTIKYFKRKYNEAQQQLNKKIAEAVAPGQADKFLEKMINEDECENARDLIPAELIRFKNIFRKSDNLGRLIVLSLVDHKNYSKQYLMNVFNCSKYFVEKARKLQDENEALLIPKPTVFRRDKLNIVKCEHFLDFIFTSGILQDVAYGVNRIKFDSGEEQKIAKAILTTKYSHAIHFYNESCIQSNYQPLSDSTLYSIC